MSRSGLWRWVVVVALVGAGLAGAMVALGSRGADDEFLLRQRNPLQLTTANVERLVRSTAPSPAPPHRKNATRARCTPGSPTGLKNPWRCSLVYPAGVTAVYPLSFRGDGSYVGRHSGGSGVIRGCCVDVPGG